MAFVRLRSPRFLRLVATTAAIAALALCSLGVLSAAAKRPVVAPATSHSHAAAARSDHADLRAQRLERRAQRRAARQAARARRLALRQEARAARQQLREQARALRRGQRRRLHAARTAMRRQHARVRSHAAAGTHASKRAPKRHAART